MRRLISALLFLALAALPVRASTFGGQVVSAEDGRPLGFAAISLSLDEQQWSVLCGSDGRFRIERLAAGTYRVEVKYLGFAPLVRELALPLAADGAPLLFELQPEAIVLDPLEVQGNRAGLEKEVQTGFVELNSEQLAAIPAFVESDPIRALQLLPGVQAASDISSGLYVRGGGPDQNLVLFDGVPIYNPTHAFGLFSSFHPDLVEEVTLYKGAYPAEYGGRLGSVLDIRSLGGGQEETRTRIGVSTIASRAAVEGRWGDRSWAVGARRTYLEPVLSALRSSDSSIPSYWFGDLNAKLTVPSRNGRTELRVYGSRDALGINADASTQIDLNWDNLALSAEHRRAIGESIVWRSDAWYSRYRSDTDLQILNTPIRFANRLRDVSATSALQWQLPPHHRLQFGLQASRYEFSYLQEFNLDRQVDYGARAWDLAAVVEDVWRPSVEATLRVGVRGRWLSDGSRVRVEPRLSWRQQLSDRWTWKLGGGLYHQVLQLVSTEAFTGTDFYLPIDGNTSPSRSIQAVAGLEFDLSRRWQLTVEAYGTQLDDLVVFDDQAPGDQSATTADDVFVTGGTGWAAGTEWFLQKRTGKWTGWLGYTLGWTRRTFAEINDGASFPTKYDRRHDLSLVLRRQSGPWEWGLSFVYGTGQAFTPAAARYGVRNPATGEISPFGDILPAERNSGRFLPYHRMDVSVTRDFRLFGRSARWMAQVFNLYSRRNDWFVTYDDEDPGASPDLVRQLPVLPSLGLEVEF